jgi:ABC-type uncharacterized transport system substrate-binding protein
MPVTVGRRELIAGLGSTVAWPLAARAQQFERMRRIGIVMPFAKGDSDGEARIRAFKQELAKLGWTDGGNIQFDERWLTDDMDLVRSHAASLVASNPDIIVASGGRIVPVFMRLTRSIPMVLPGASDPVGVGWAQSFSESHERSARASRLLPTLWRGRKRKWPSVVLGIAHQDADPAHPAWLLPARRERPRDRRTAEQCDELAPL